MKCRTFLNLLDSDKLEGNVEAKDHLESCESCRKAFESMNMAFKELKKMKDEDIPPFLHSRIMATVEAEKGKEPSLGRISFWGRNRWAVPVLAAFLVVLLGGVTLTTLFRRGEKLEAPQTSGNFLAESSAPETEKGKTEEGARSKSIKEEESAKKDSDELAPPARKPGQVHKGPKLQLSEDLREVHPVDSETDASAKSAPAPAAPPAPELTEKSKRRAEPAIGQAPSENRGALGNEMASGYAGLAIEDKNQGQQTVLCALKGNEGVYYAFQVPSQSSPPPGVSWSLTVESSGRIKVRDAENRKVSDSILTDVVDAVLRLELQPGTYQLHRVK